MKVMEKGDMGKSRRTGPSDPFLDAKMLKGQMGASACHIWMWGCARLRRKKNQPN